MHTTPKMAYLSALATMMPSMNGPSSAALYFPM
ncbi:hypothetical protein ACHAW6_001701 [Cyclotella cf. meneghiniana]